MTSTESPPVLGKKGWMRRIPGLLLRAVKSLLLALVIAWGALALWFSPLPSVELRIALGLAFAAFGIWAVWVTRRPRMRWVFVALYAVLLVGWSFIRPTHDREWRPDVAVMPRATIDGDKVHITGVRNFDYRSRDDFTVRYDERDVSLSHLVALDFFISYWMPGPVGHTFLSFVFDNAPPLNVSIETRPEPHEGFDPLASLFKQYELIYVVGEERDIVGVRTNFRGEDVYMYRLRVPAQSARALFQVYLKRINELADRPEFYHLLSNSCTINIVRYANLVGRQGDFDIRHYLNGWVDRYFYDTRLLDTEFAFPELRRRSRVDPAVQASDDVVGFAQHIRETVPGMPRQARDPAADVATALAAYQWQLVSAKDAAGQSIPAFFPARDQPLGLLAADGRLNVTGGCNRISAGYTWVDGGQLQVGPGQSTMMACPPPLADADAAVSRFLAGTLQVSIAEANGARQLRLAAADGATLTFDGTPTPETRFGGPGTRAFLEVSPDPCKLPAPMPRPCVMVRDRQFDENGLASGTPGEWRALPNGIEGYAPVPGEQQVVRVKRFEQAGNPPTEHFVFDLVVESRSVK